MFTIDKPPFRVFRCEGGLRYVKKACCVVYCLMENNQTQPMQMYNMNQRIQNNLQNSQSMNMQQPMNQEQQVIPQQGPINFVYGPQNNNQNM